MIQLRRGDELRRPQAGLEQQPSTVALDVRDIRQCRELVSNAMNHPSLASTRLVESNCHGTSLHDRSEVWGRVRVSGSIISTLCGVRSKTRLPSCNRVSSRVEKDDGCVFGVHLVQQGLLLHMRPTRWMLACVGSTHVKRAWICRRSVPRLVQPIFSQKMASMLAWWPARSCKFSMTRWSISNAFAQSSRGTCQETLIDDF